MRTMDVKIDQFEVNLTVKDDVLLRSYSRTLYHYNDAAPMWMVTMTIRDIAVSYDVKVIDVISREGVGRIAYESLSEDAAAFGFAVRYLDDFRLV